MGIGNARVPIITETVRGPATIAVLSGEIVAVTRIGDPIDPTVRASFEEEPEATETRRTRRREARSNFHNGNGRR